MKYSKIYKIASLTLLSFVATGCDDFLVRDHPTGITDDNFWATSNQAANALGQCKHMPGGTFYYDAPYMALVHMEGMTDNMYHVANFKGEFVNIGNGSHSPTSGGIINDLWHNWYIRIRRCNRFLENIHKPYFSDEKDRARMRAEARVWRAWYHMQLLMYYGGREGIPLVTRSLAADEVYVGRTSFDECMNFINSEFDAVINSDDLEFLWDESRRDRMSISIALALKMQVNLYYKNYEIAQECAKQLIESKKFELHYTESDDDDPGKHYRDLFRYVGKQNKERILFRSRGLAEFWFRSMSTGLGGQGTTNPTKSLVDTYELADGRTLAELPEAERLAIEKDPLSVARDPRLYTTVMMPSDSTSVLNYTYLPFNADGSDAIGKPGASRSGYMLKKYLDEQDRSSPAGGSLDFSLIRYAEVLLSYVECLVESGKWQDPQVFTYLNMIRNRAGMPDVDQTKYNTQEKLRELYRRERRVELCFEGSRYFDIKRWGIGKEAMSGDVHGAWNPITKAFIVVESRNYISPKHDVWPLPQNEITANENIHQILGW